MSFGFEKLLPSDCLNINEFRKIHVNRSYCLNFTKFGGVYQFAIKFACLAYHNLPKEAFI